MLTPVFLHYLAIGLVISFGSFGSALGQGIGAFGAVGAMSRQPKGNDQIFRTMIIGLAFIETGMVLSLVIALLLLFGINTPITHGIAIAELGIALVVGISATAIGIASSFAVKSASVAISRQPFFSQKIITIMLIAQSIIEAPVIFAFILALLIWVGFDATVTIYDGIKYFAACFCMALGCIGPSCGQAILAESSCKAAGYNRAAYNKIFTFSIINEAVIETPMIFCLLVSILIIFMPIPLQTPTSTSITLIAAALVCGLGALGSGIAMGLVASKSCDQITLSPENYAVLFRSTILSQAFIESSVIYALIVALALITKTY